MFEVTELYNLSTTSVLWQLLTADWAVVVVLQPGLDAVGVVGVAARQEHAFVA